MVPPLTEEDYLLKAEMHRAWTRREPGGFGFKV